MWSLHNLLAEIGSIFNLNMGSTELNENGIHERVFGLEV